MRTSAIIFSVGITVLILGSIVFPLTTTPTTFRGNFTLPPWAKTAYLSGNITINGTYTTTSLVLNNTSDKIYGNFTVTFHGIQLFQGDTYKIVGVSLTIIGLLGLTIRYLLSRKKII